MICQDVAELVTDYLEEALSHEICRQVEAHLAECPDCPSFYKQMRLTILLIGKAANSEYASKKDN